MGCVSEIKISYKNRVTSSNLTKISSSSDAAKILLETWDNDTIQLHESFKIMLLNNSNIVKGIYEISSDGITGTVVDIRIIFAVVLKSLSTAIILAHNHPSGNLKPSDADKRLTSKIKQASELLDIKLLDHLIITPSQEYFSFADDGII